jgi:hypothetical protein
MRIFQDRNPALVSGIVFADAVNPDFIEGVGFGNRFPVGFDYVFGTKFLAPSGLMIILTSIFPAIVASGAGMDPNYDNVMIPDIARRYAYVVSKTRWYENGRDEWVGWPENAARTAESGTLKDGKLGDLPIYVFAARDSIAFDSYEQPLALKSLSTVSQSQVVDNAEHGFIFQERNQEMFVGVIMQMAGITLP